MTSILTCSCCSFSTMRVGKITDINLVWPASCLVHQSPHRQWALHRSASRPACSRCAGCTRPAPACPRPSRPASLPSARARRSATSCRSTHQGTHKGVNTLHRQALAVQRYQTSILMQPCAISRCQRKPNITNAYWYLKNTTVRTAPAHS
jgi:hypothetical protein